jgi:hypothetical protein
MTSANMNIMQNSFFIFFNDYTSIFLFTDKIELVYANCYIKKIFAIANSFLTPKSIAQ